MTDKTELEVTAGDMDAAAKVSGFDTWADAVYWSNLAKQSAVQDLAQAFARHRIATRTPDPTPVAWSDEESFKHLRLLYNYTDNDSHQFTRWQMVVAMSHGMRLARQPAVPADGLVEALAKGGFMMTETHNVGEHRGRKLVIGFQNPDEADDAMQAIAVAVKTFRSAA